MSIPDDYTGSVFKRYDHGGRKKKSKYCRVPGCLQKNSVKTSMHIFPKNTKLRKEWMIKCRLRIIQDYFTICSHHFAATDFFPDYANQKRYLKKFAVPSKNLPIKSFSEYPRNARTKLSIEEIENQKKLRQIRAEKRVSVKGNAVEKGYQIVTIDPTTINMEIGTEKPMETESPLEKEHQIVKNDPVIVHNQIKSDQSIEVVYVEDAKAARPVQHLISTASIKVNPTSDFLPKFSIFDFLHNKTLLIAWTGLPSFEFLHSIEHSMRCAYPHFMNGRSRNSVIELIMLCFIKLKMNISYVAMTAMFHVSGDTIFRNFGTMIPYLAQTLKPHVYFPSVEETRSNLPKAFVKYGYATVRAILQCSEIKMQVPRCTNCRILAPKTVHTCPHNKDRIIKFSICITPGGLISHVTKGYSGISFKQIFNAEELIEKFDCPEDLVIGKKVIIGEEIESQDFTLVRRSFFRAGVDPLEEPEEVSSIHIDVLRVHVEQALQRMKIFAILTERVEYNVAPYVNDILIIIAAVANATKPIIAGDKF